MKASCGTESPLLLLVGVGRHRPREWLRWGSPARRGGHRAQRGPHRQAAGRGRQVRQEGDDRSRPRLRSSILAAFYLSTPTKAIVEPSGFGGLEGRACARIFAGIGRLRDVPCSLCGGAMCRAWGLGRREVKRGLSHALCTLISLELRYGATLELRYIGQKHKTARDPVGWRHVGRAFGWSVGAMAPRHPPPHLTARGCLGPASGHRDSSWLVPPVLEGLKSELVTKSCSACLM